MATYYFSDVARMRSAWLNVFTSWKDLAGKPADYDPTGLTISIQLDDQRQVASLPRQLDGIRSIEYAESGHLPATGVAA